MPRRAKYIYIIIGLRFFIFTISATIEVLFISSAFCFPTWQLPNRLLALSGWWYLYPNGWGLSSCRHQLTYFSCCGRLMWENSAQHPRMIFFILLPIFILWIGSADSSDPLRQYLNLYFENEGSFQGFG